MEDRSLRILEFNKIIAMLAEKCVSGPGRDMALALKPEKQRLLIDNALDETNEAVGFILRNGIFADAHVPFRKGRSKKGADRRHAVDAAAA